MNCSVTEILEENSSDDEGDSDAGSGSTDDSDSEEGLLSHSCCAFFISTLNLSWMYGLR